MAAESPHVTVRSLEADGVLLLSSSTAGFEAALTANREKAYDKVLPYTVVIQNRTAQQIIAYSVVWNRVGKNGQLRSAQRSVFNFSRLPDGELMPSESHIVSIYPELEAGGRVWNPGLEDIATRLVGLFESDRSVEIVLDAVLFADGGAIGPDSARWIPRWEAWLDGEKEVMTKAAGSSDSELMPLLEGLATPGRELARNRNGSEADLGLLATMADRSGSYPECSALVRAYYALSIRQAVELGRTEMMDNVRRTARWKYYPAVHGR